MFDKYELKSMSSICYFVLITPLIPSLFSIKSNWISLTFGSVHLIWPTQSLLR